nr:Gfo/Idh/MocA family oxidoreductase [Rhizobiaceae bacterium]
MSVRVAVIGAGIMGADHARIIASDIPGATLQVVCDADAARAKTVADATGAADAMTDPLAAIARPDIDAVLIASPDQTHRPLSLAAIVAGKPALCEKPLATTSPECLEIVASETNAGRKLVQVGFMRRFDPAYVEMKATLAYGRIGAAMMFHCIHRN